MQAMHQVIGIFIFCVTYYYYNFNTAALATALLASIQVSYTYLRYGQLNWAKDWSAILIICSGLATWYFQDPAFVQWKLSILHAATGTWILTRVLQHKNGFISTLLAQENYHLPAAISRRADLGMAVYMLSIAVINYVVFSYYSEETWVWFKASLVVVSIVFMSILVILITPYVKEQKNEA